MLHSQLAEKELEDDRTAAEILKLALDAANVTDNSRYKVSTIKAIAQAYIKLEDTQTAAEILKLVLDAANTIDNPDDKAKALTATAKAHEDLGNWRPMLEIRQKCPTKKCEIDVLTLALTVWAEKQNTAIADRKN